MILNLLSTYDSKAEAWTLPFFMSSTESIERAWSTVVNDPTSRFNMHPNDYSLFHLGEWDCKKGSLVLYEAKRSIGLAAEYLHSPK